MLRYQSVATHTRQIGLGSRNSATGGIEKKYFRFSSIMLFQKKASK
jgi:hypothetical protein